MTLGHGNALGSGVGVGDGVGVGVGEDHGNLAWACVDTVTMSAKKRGKKITAALCITNLH